MDDNNEIGVRTTTSATVANERFSRCLLQLKNALSPSRINSGYRSSSSSSKDDQLSEIIRDGHELSELLSLAQSSVEHVDRAQFDEFITSTLPKELFY